MRFEFCVLGGMQNNSYRFSLSLFSQELNTVMVDPLLRSLQDSHAQGHVTLALKTKRLLQDVRSDAVLSSEEMIWRRIQNDQLGSCGEEMKNLV